MLKIGDVVVYGSQGVCRIDSLQTKQIDKQNIDYYVLKPIFKESTSVFVPVENTLLVSKMQDVLTVAKAKELVDKIPQIVTFEYKDENHKREHYKAVLAGGSREDLISLIKTINNEREVRRQNSKKLNINDEQTLRKAEQLFYNELAYIYDVQPDEVKNMVKF